MMQSAEDQAAKQINVLAARNGWPLLADPNLRFLTPQIRTVLAVWQAQRGARTMPARSDMTLPDLKTALPNLSFLDIVRDGDRTRFKVRLAGGALDNFLSGPTTGRFIDEAIPHPFAEKWAALWRPTVNLGTLMRIVARVEFPDRRYYMSETLHAPLAGDGQTPDILMLAVYFHGRQDGPFRVDIATQLTTELDRRAQFATA